MKVNEKRHLRIRWHAYRHQNDKKAFNRATWELKYLISEIKNESTQKYLENWHIYDHIMLIKRTVFSRF